MSQIAYRQLTAAGDVLAWQIPERYLATDWPDGQPLIVACWDGQFAIAPEE